MAVDIERHAMAYTMATIAVYVVYDGSNNNTANSRTRTSGAASPKDNEWRSVKFRFRQIGN